MLKLNFSRKAISDLSEIWEYTRDEWSEEQADKYYRSLVSECNAIASNPEKGRLYSDVVSGLRGCHCGRHIIFYMLSDSVTIIRILHERMDIVSRLMCN